MAKRIIMIAMQGNIKKIFLDGFDDFVADWKAQGGEKITAEIEEALAGEP